MKPLCLIIDSSADNKFALYIEEVLRIEGYNAMKIIDIALNAEIDLKGCCLTVISSTASKRIDLQYIEEYVSSGGLIIAIKPPLEWDYLFGLERMDKPVYSKTNDRYLITNKDIKMTRNIIPEMIQFFGEADLYDVKEAKCLNYICGAPDPERASVYPGAALCSYGMGKAAIFTYELSETIVYLHQGNPLYSSEGEFPDSYGTGKFIPYDLLKGQFDYRFRMIPQADVHQDYLVALIKQMLDSRYPVPRIWHFPDAVPAVAFISGDSDKMIEEEYDRRLDDVEKYGGKLTCYIMDDDQKEVPVKKAAQLKEKGHDFGPHFFCGFMPTLDEMKREIERAVESFKKRYGFQPLTHRSHGAVWTGYTEMAEMLLENGIRMDTNFSAGVPGFGEGILNGSCLPFKFITPNGEILNIYEQCTLITDDVFSPKRLLKRESYEQVTATSMKILDLCIHYHGVFTSGFHPLYAMDRRRFNTNAWHEEILKGCKNAGLPFVSGSEWVRFNDARRSIKITEVDWTAENGLLSFFISSAEDVKGITLMLPAEAEQKKPVSILADGHVIEFSVSGHLEDCMHLLITLDIKENETRKIEVLYKRHTK